MGLKNLLRRKKMGKVVEPTTGKVWQEFYCAISGGGCGGYIMVRINMAINGVVKVICPNCKHSHGRIIEKGHIRESWSGQSHSLGRNDSSDQEIVPTMAAFSKKPQTMTYLTKEKSSYGTHERTCPIVNDPNKDIADALVRQSWAERHGVK